MLDHESRVIDCNLAARNLVDAPEEWCGKPAAEFFSSLPSSVHRRLLEEPPQTELSIEESESTRWFALERRAVESSHETPDGRLIVLREITTQKQRETALEQHNERLEEFAGTVAHELQNPLNVAQAHLKLLRGQDHNEHLEAIETAHDRLEQQIDDVLTLVRVDDTIADDTSLQLADVATAATDHIDLADCDCEILIPPATTVRGDYDQLLRVFENLYQNACIHNDTVVTVRVGLLGQPETQHLDHPQGFFIEDTGEGIPAEIRTAVLERGYTTHTEGTGFGLSIVQTIVDAHGWEMNITESADGGARFEITGVEINLHTE
jgi:signal transduction histidine kinase